MQLSESELILNPDGSIYHLNLLPEHIAETLIFVGDPDRVEKVTKHFDHIEFTIQKREFKTQTGSFNGKRITVISTGIGFGNIDIVLNELDALVNIDLTKRKIKTTKTALSIVRIGTSGAVQPDIAVDSFLMSKYALDLNSVLYAYNINSVNKSTLADSIARHLQRHSDMAKPLVFCCNDELSSIFKDSIILSGITATAGGFYAPQGRSLRLPLADKSFRNKLQSWSLNNLKITNLEMETAAIYGMAGLLGHKAVSLNAILANRANGTFSSSPEQTVEKLIKFTLEKLSKT